MVSARVASDLHVEIFSFLFFPSSSDPGYQKRAICLRQLLM